MVDRTTSSCRQAVAFALLLAASTGAMASGFALLEQSASRLGTAFAGTGVAADDLTTLYFNPAGMRGLAKTEGAMLPSAIYISSEFHTNGSTAAFGQPLGNDGGNAGGMNFVPSAYIATPINADFAVGLGINAPFGLKLEYDDGWMGRFQALNSEIQTLNVNPAVSWRVTPHFAIGIGANHQRMQAELTSAVNYSAVIAQGLQQLAAQGQIPPAQLPALIAANAGLEGHTRVRGDDTALGYNVGVLFDISPTTRVSLAYRSSLEYDVKGTVRFTAPAVPAGPGATVVALASSAMGRLANGSVSLDLELPYFATVSFWRQIGPNLELMADVARTGWSSIPELRIVRSSGAVLSVTPEDWDDTWRYALGAAYQINPQWKLRLGVAYDETPVPDSTRTPRLPDTNRTWAAIGARWTPSSAWTIDAGYAHLFSEDVPLNQDNGDVTLYGRLLGEQQSAIDILSLQLAYRFGS